MGVFYVNEKIEPYTKEPYPVTYAELREKKNEKQSKGKKGSKQGSRHLLNVCDKKILKLDNFLQMCYNVGENSRLTIFEKM